MYLADYHLHTLCSPDGSHTLAQMAQAAVDAGLDEICVTDHCDLLDMSGRPDRSFRWEPIEEQLAVARPKFAGRLPIKMGLELGEAWEDPDFARALVSRPGVDFVIGSVHNLSSRDGGRDFYFEKYTDEDACHAVLRPYMDCLEALAGLDCVDVLGHILYPLRYMNGRDGNQVTLEPYYPQLERVFKTLIARGGGMEVNTCRGETVEDWREILSLYRDCGGVIVTLGSDAHRPHAVGAGLTQAAGLLREYGFRLAVYEKRVPKLIQL